MKECGGLPLALAMIGAMIQRRPERWEDTLERLRRADIDKIRRNSPDYPYPDLLRAIEVNLDVLAPEEQRRFAELGVFVSDDPVPEAIVAALWSRTGSLSVLEPLTK